jgi:hypothetical protein
MTEYNFDRPVFILGAARSGTTMLGEILSLHPDVAYWLEPKYIWRYGNAGSTDDHRGAAQADKNTREYIRKKFYRFLRSENKSRFIEKTPSNVFRIAFIDKVFPEALFIYIERDGRDVCLSAEKKWTSRPSRSALYRRMTRFEIPFRDLPAYSIAFVRDVIGRIVAPKKGYIWGPQFKGIQAYRRQHSVLECCAKQWLESLESAESALSRISDSRVLRIRYEDLQSSYNEQIKLIFDFIGLDLSKAEKEILNYPIQERREHSNEEKEKIDKILNIISTKLKELNYS